MSVSMLKKVVVASLACGFSLSAMAADTGKSPQLSLNQKQKKEVLSSLSETLVEAYVNEQTALSMSAKLKQLSKQLDKSQSGDPDQFSEYLTEQLQQVSGDKHIRVEYSPEPLSLSVSDEVNNSYESEEEKAMWRSNNLGFDKLERLPFNIGYMKLMAFAPLDEASPMLASAFTFLNNSNSLIIDLRGNFGGFEYTGTLFTSYFLQQKTHLLDMHWRKDNRVEQRWSTVDVDGPKYGEDKKVYILVDARTFSAGEAFAYTMKHLGRATIVGEKTAGAGNAGEYLQLTPHFKAFVPMRRGVNPITKTFFEGVGVQPDIKSASSDALKVAQMDYLKSIKDPQKEPRRAKRIDRRIATLESSAGE